MYKFTTYHMLPHASFVLWKYNKIQRLHAPDHQKETYEGVPKNYHISKETQSVLWRVLTLPYHYVIYIITKYTTKLSSKPGIKVDFIIEDAYSF